MSLQVNGTVLTDSGRRRSENEDWCGCVTAAEGDDPTHTPSAWVVADGVSGYNGREASRLAVESVLSARWNGAPERIEATLLGAIERANQALYERAGEGSTGATGRLASTLLVAVVLGKDAWLANVGDCRGYLIRAGQIRQLTRDHTWVAEQVAMGRLRPEEAASHPKSNVLTRCLGHRPTVQADVFHETLEPDDRLVLCSDGLTRHVSGPELIQIGTRGEPQDAARALIDLANRRGGTDNITVAVLELTLPTEPPQRVADRSPHTRLAADRVSALQSISQRINASLDLRETLRSVMDSLVEITGAERGFVMLLDEASGRLAFQIGRNLDARSVARDPEISRNIVQKVFKDCQPLLIGDAMADPEFQAFQSVVLHSLRSVICAPLAVKGKPIGVVYVDSSLQAGLFNQSDLDLLMAFANMAASAIENARLHERVAGHARQIEAMKTSQDRILRSVSNGILSVDREGKVISFNRAAADMLAVPIEEALDKPLSVILPPRFMLALGLPLGGEGVEPGATIQGFEMEGELRGRGYVHLGHRLSPLRDEDGKTIGYVIVLDDMTERERLERERSQAAAEREKIKSVFEHYMAPAVFQELMRQGPDRSGIGGDSRDLTLLFADIRGFTSFSEEHRPEQVVEMLNAFLSAATKVIFDHDGTIDKFIGDEIMALFGAPLEIADHPLQAIKAALAMQQRFAETPQPDGSRVSWGIGINSGSGIVGTIGAPELMSYTAIGDVVNVAARLQAEAREGEVLITADTYARVRDNVLVEDLGRMDLKGKRGRVNVYKVTGLRGP